MAQLRLLIVEPAAPGIGIGMQWVDEYTRFARAAGHQHIRLWINGNNNSNAARALYAQAGSQLIADEPHESFGLRLVGETWELRL